MNRMLLAFAAFICCSLICNVPSYGQNTREITKGNCSACAAECQKALDYCAKKGGRYAEGSLTNVLKDCITACNSASEYLTRGSTFSPKAASICIEACNNCAKACESFKDDDKMRATADECRKCAGNCSKVKAGAS